MNMQFCAFRQRDWLQQYANAKSLQKLLQTFASFAAFILFSPPGIFAQQAIYFNFILFYMC